MNDLRPALRLPTQDPFTGESLVVTRLENPVTGVAFEGRFELGWLERVTPEQLDFIGLLLARRNNVQRLAADLGIAYNSARSRLEEIGRAVGGPDAAGADNRSPDPDRGTASSASLRDVLARVASGELSQDEADALLAQADQ